MKTSKAASASTPSGRATPIPDSSSKRVLEPHDRISEVLFGLIMVLTFTGSLSIAEVGREDIRIMLIGALGCNLAWGIIDGVLYLMGCLAEKGRNLVALQRLRKATNPDQAQKLIARALPPLVASVLRPEEYASIGERLKQLPEPPEQARLGKEDWWGAGAVFLLVFLCTFPVVVPFIFMQNARLALRVSNCVAIMMLFTAGMAYGRSVGRRSWMMGILMVGLGLVLGGLTILLGG
jgi:VIT1/CCC1 family predicted Fe2+/Mn2+ transporter